MTSRLPRSSFSVAMLLSNEICTPLATTRCHAGFYEVQLFSLSLSQFRLALSVSFLSLTRRLFHPTPSLYVQLEVVSHVGRRRFEGGRGSDSVQQEQLKEDEDGRE